MRATVRAQHRRCAAGAGGPLHKRAQRTVAALTAEALIDRRRAAYAPAAHPHPTAGTFFNCFGATLAFTPPSLRKQPKLTLIMEAGRECKAANARPQIASPAPTTVLFTIASANVSLRVPASAAPHAQRPCRSPTAAARRMPGPCTGRAAPPFATAGHAPPAPPTHIHPVYRSAPPPWM